MAGSGAKAIYYKGSAITASYLQANRTYTFVYDGTNWNVVGELTKVVNSNPTLAWSTTPTIGTVDGVELKVTMPANPDTNTHYTIGLYVGASGAKSNAATSNGSTYLKLYDDSTSRASFKISGSGATTVSSDANGNITISSTDTNTNTDTKVNVTLDTTTKAYLLGTSTTPTSSAQVVTSIADTGVYLSTTADQLTATTFYATSDKRLKENIIPYACNKSILDLPVYEYNFIKDPVKTKHIGCLAQDLQEVCPELVCTEADGYLTINESKIVYLLLDEVKKLKAEVEELKTKI